MGISRIGSITGFSGIGWRTGLSRIGSIGFSIIGYITGFSRIGCRTGFSKGCSQSVFFINLPHLWQQSVHALPAVDI